MRAHILLELLANVDSFYSTLLCIPSVLYFRIGYMLRVSRAIIVATTGATVVDLIQHL